jgi:hypothetical protein
VRKGRISRLVVGCSPDRQPPTDAQATAVTVSPPVKPSSALAARNSMPPTSPRYYASDVVFSLTGDLTLNGSNAIIDFYRPFHSAVDETVDIEFIVMDDKHAAVEIATEFHARKD